MRLAILAVLSLSVPAQASLTVPCDNHFIYKIVNGQKVVVQLIKGSLDCDRQGRLGSRCTLPDGRVGILNDVMLPSPRGGSVLQGSASFQPSPYNESYPNRICTGGTAGELLDIAHNMGQRGVLRDNSFLPAAVQSAAAAAAAAQSAAQAAAAAAAGQGKGGGSNPTPPAATTAPAKPPAPKPSTPAPSTCIPSCGSAQKCKKDGAYYVCHSKCLRDCDADGKVCRRRWRRIILNSNCDGTVWGCMEEMSSTPFRCRKTLLYAFATGGSDGDTDPPDTPSPSSSGGGSGSAGACSRGSGKYKVHSHHSDCSGCHTVSAKYPAKCSGKNNPASYCESDGSQQP